MMKRISTAFLTVIATALVAVAKPPRSNSAALLHEQSGSGLYARMIVDPYSVAPQCQPYCTPVLQRLDACTSVLCQCTQTNLDAIGVCINCLVPLGSKYVYSPGASYTDTYWDYCAGQRIQLIPALITAVPTGTATTGDPLTMFERPTPTFGAVTTPFVPSYYSYPTYSYLTYSFSTYSFPAFTTDSFPTPGRDQPNFGSALNAFRALGTSVAVATGAAIVILGVSCSWDTVFECAVL